MILEMGVKTKIFLEIGESGDHVAIRRARVIRNLVLAREAAEVFDVAVDVLVIAGDVVDPVERRIIRRRGVLSKKGKHNRLLGFHMEKHSSPKSDECVPKFA